ncbi:MAG: quinone-dependent dihydroorotate dehydrogenase [Cellvibrionales bacterium]|nr:quinone-dependent dihydroorotate dehydrogenase [Cellvibrionales bacterium]
MYSAIRPLLFKLEAEKAHDLTLKSIKLAHQLKLLTLFTQKIPDKPRTVMGIDFKNPVGLAAGLDKNADYVEALSGLGFGFIEVGTVTPRAQEGNPKPRLFRLEDEQAIINRMGFNNKGLNHLIRQVNNRNDKLTLGINIGKNKLTPNDKAIDDYLLGLEAVYPYADYVTVNLSSPNTPGLRDLQFGEPLRHLLEQLKTKQQTLATNLGRYVPMVLKVAPDMAEEDIRDVADALLSFEIDGLIATNTTITRPIPDNTLHGCEAGGLSGKPLMPLATQAIQQFYSHLGSQIPIIAAGGITEPVDALKKIEAGASLVQIYSGLIYQGPDLIKDIVRVI